MKDLMLVFGLLAVWIALNRWVLPWFGISTCMSGGCAMSCCPTTDVKPRPQDGKSVSQSQGDLP